MQNRILLITGATDGIGKVAAKALAKKGHTVIIHGRNKNKAQTVCEEIKLETGNDKVDTLIADLFSFTDIKRMTEDFKKKYDRLDVLINNAGAIFSKEREITKDGLEKTMTLNVFSPLLLTELLLDVLVKSPSARIINTSSATHKIATKPDFSDLQLEKNYTPSKAYALSKLYTIWITRHLAIELKDRGFNNITANALHPGAVATRFGQDNDKGFIQNMIFKVALPFMASPEKGAATTVYLATSKEVENVTEKFFGNMKEEKPQDKHYSAEHEKILWDYCMKIIGPYLD
ncbi:SDR family NAD(P)-dependent oxidoreductase [Niallia nealsonii]|uniref:Ketoreductase n=1 Tax=Niallia nealsonii TaxID=115979 RepID=A0A2N0YZG6_9BACI|nr:SDR family NAD(P)-dependent oxidoreductase [Niallia nealsonii]PKG22643.1 ketoreductase [Niallia nealsonii]